MLSLGLVSAFVLCFSAAYVPEEYLLLTNKKRDADDCSWLSTISSY